MNKGFLPFLRRITENGRLAVCLALFTVGMLFLAFGGFGGLSGEAVSDGEELRELCSEIDGVGDCLVMVRTSDEGEVVSVAVLCDGAESASVRASLTELISELYGIRTSRISILKLAK